MFLRNPVEAMQSSVLLVENETESREVLEIAIRRKFPGIVVSTASTGIEAVEIFRKTPHDIVITDLRVSGMDGVQIAEAVRRIKSGIRVILVSGDSECAAAFDECLVKPLDIHDFLGAIRRNIG